MKCTVLLVFSCVFTVFSLQKHIFLVHFTCIYQNTHVLYILYEMHSFASVVMCFHCVFTAETCVFATFPLYTKIHIYHTFYMKCIVLLVFSCISLSFQWRNMNFWYISHEFTKIHLFNIFYMKCTVLLVFSCVFTVFSLQKHELLVHFI
jgi:hypothetical protein